MVSYKAENKQLQRPLSLDLQLFSGEKTEKATPKRRSQAREEGRVAKSMEVNSALVLLAVFTLFNVYFATMFRDLQVYVGDALSNIYLGEDLNATLIGKLFLDTLFVLGKLTLPLMLVAMVAGLIANYAQVGVLFTLKPLNLNLNAINPINGMKKFFSARVVVDLIKSILKMLIVGYVSYTTIQSELPVFFRMLDMKLSQSLPFIGKLIVQIGFKVAIILLIIAFADYAFQKYDLDKSLKMSKQEIKEEHKNIEGDPQIKGKIKAKQRQMAMQRMMQDVPKADVVITNPTHFAVAIKYDGKDMAAPQVVAKGVDAVAHKIKEIAKEHKVPTVENKPLAQALFKACEIGEFIPPDLFQAVAEVLAFVYKLRGKV